MSNKFTVNFYETLSGYCPVEEFIRSQNIKMRAKIYKTLELLEEFGNNLRLPYSEHLSDGIFQIRVKFGSDITRILYFFVSGSEIILTNAFVKKTQATPPLELELAKKYRDDFFSRLEC